MKVDGACSIVVTGGASGLGRAVVDHLTGLGAKVTIFDLDQSSGERAAAETGARFVKVDVTSDASVEAGFAAARDCHGQEGVLICCAGMLFSRRTVGRGSDGAPREFPVTAFADALSVNLTGTFRCIVHSAAGMMTREADEAGERGVIITTSSITAEDGTVGNAAYAASKAAVAGLTLPIARDLMSEGVRINSILPGFFSTPMTAGFGDAANAAYVGSIPFPRRLGHPREFADLARHIVENSYLNAAAVRLDGAMRLGLP